MQGKVASMADMERSLPTASLEDC